MVFKFLTTRNLFDELEGVTGTEKRQTLFIIARSPIVIDSDYNCKTEKWIKKYGTLFIANFKISTDPIGPKSWKPISTRLSCPCLSQFRIQSIQLLLEAGLPLSERTLPLFTV